MRRRKLFRDLVAHTRRERALARAWQAEVERTGWPLGSIHLPKSDG